MTSSTVSRTVQRRLRMQGYACPGDDPEFARVVPWLRFTTVLCGVWVAIGTALRSPKVLIGLVPIAVFGAVSDRHPFDHLYNHGLRRLTGTDPLPPNGAPRRFACGLAAVWLMATAGAFSVGAVLTGYVLASVLLGVNVIVNVTHFCIPSFVYRTVFDRTGADR